jgi:hypothetical protein
MSKGAVADEEVKTLSLYLIERNFGEQVELTKDVAEELALVIAEEGNRWLQSFLSADKKKMYCLFDAPNADTILAAAKRLGTPADVIVPVGEVWGPSGLIDRAHMAASSPADTVETL